MITEHRPYAHLTDTELKAEQARLQPYVNEYHRRQAAAETDARLRRLEELAGDFQQALPAERLEHARTKKRIDRLGSRVGGAETVANVAVRRAFAVARDLQAETEERKADRDRHEQRFVRIEDTALAQGKLTRVACDIASNAERRAGSLERDAEGLIQRAFETKDELECVEARLEALETKRAIFS